MSGEIKSVKPILHEWPTAHGLLRIVRVPGASYVSCETLDIDAGQWRACHPMEFMLADEIVSLRDERDALILTIDDSRRIIDKYATEIAALREKYDELLHAVGRKFPNETRHQTALRFIREAERVEVSSCQPLAGCGGE